MLIIIWLLPTFTLQGLQSVTQIIFIKTELLIFGTENLDHKSSVGLGLELHESGSMIKEIFYYQSTKLKADYI